MRRGKGGGKGDWYLGTLGTLPSQQLLRGHGSLGSHQWQWTFSRRREHLAPTVWRAQIPKTWGDPVTQITPWSSTWNLKISPLKRWFWKLLFSGSMEISSFFVVHSLETVYWKTMEFQQHLFCSERFSVNIFGVHDIVHDHDVHVRKHNLLVYHRELKAYCKKIIE